MPPRLNPFGAVVPRANHVAADNVPANAPNAAPAPVAAAQTPARGLPGRVRTLAGCLCFPMELNERRHRNQAALAAVDCWNEAHGGEAAQNACNAIKTALPKGFSFRSRQPVLQATHLTFPDHYANGISKLRSIPPELGQVTTLQELNINSHELVNFPPEMGQATALQYLYLSNNRLTSFPVEMGQAKALQRLNLNNNQLTRFPAEMGQATALLSINLNNNQLNSLPAEIARLPNLQDLRLRNNRFTWVPRALLEVGSHVQIDLQGNPLPAEEIRAIHAVMAERRAAGRSVPQLLLPPIPQNQGQAAPVEQVAPADRAAPAAQPITLTARVAAALGDQATAFTDQAIAFAGQAAALAARTAAAPVGQAAAFTDQAIAFAGQAAALAARMAAAPVGQAAAFTDQAIALAGRAAALTARIAAMPVVVQAAAFTDQVIAFAGQAAALAARIAAMPVALVVEPVVQAAPPRAQAAPPRAQAAAPRALAAVRRAQAAAPADRLRDVVDNNMNVHTGVLTRAFKKQLEELTKQFPGHLRGSLHEHRAQLTEIEHRLTRALDTYAIQHPLKVNTSSKARRMARLMFQKGQGRQDDNYNEFNRSAGHVLAYSFLALEAQWARTPRAHLSEARRNGMASLIQALSNGSGWCDTRLCEEVMQTIGLPLTQYAQTHAEVVGTQPAQISTQEGRDVIIEQAQRVLATLIQTHPSLFADTLRQQWRVTLLETIEADHPRIPAEQLNKEIEQIESAWETFHEMVLERRMGIVIQ